MLAVNILLWFGSFFGQVEPEQDFSIPKQDPKVQVKVLVKGRVPAFFLDVKGEFEVIDPKNGKRQIRSYAPKKGTIQIKDGIKWIDSFWGIHQIKVIPQQNDPLLVDGVEYFGSLEVIEADNLLHIINEVSVEDYIKSYLVQHFSERVISKTVLEALSIVIRTDIYHTLMRNRQAFFHIDAKKVGYQGSSLRGLYPVIDRAVDQTQNKILLYKGRPFPSTWTEHSAGQTATYKSIFRQNFDGPNGAYTPLALQNKEETRWTKEIPNEEITEQFGLSSIKKVDLFIDNESGKVYAIRFFDKHRHVDVPITELKHLFASNNFRVETTPHSIKVQGWGKGLGVGLCLYNASRLEREGASLEEILKSAFPQTTVETCMTVPELLAQAVEEEPNMWFAKKISALNESP
ncbi:MAG: SpoIID/LytB domain-containing protein [Chlamydiia bacterium]